MWQSSEVDKGMTHIHEGSSIKPSGIDNDVHKGSLWAILNRRQCTGGLNTHCTRIKDTEGIRIYPQNLSESISKLNNEFMTTDR